MSFVSEGLLHTLTRSSRKDTCYSLLCFDPDYPRQGYGSSMGGQDTRIHVFINAGLRAGAAIFTIISKQVVKRRADILIEW